MAFSKLLFLAWVYWFLSLLCFGVHSGGSEVSVNFLEAPPAVTNITSATFVFEVSINGNDGTCGTCYSCVICKLDNQISEDCADKNVSFTSLPDGKHKFEVCAAANQSQEAGCNSYHWTIDTVQPTAYLTASTLFTNAQNISVNISFSKPCIRDGGDGGFKCSAPDACNLLVHGAGHVLPSTLRILQPNLQFSLMIELSSSVQYGEVQLLMDENFCKDIAGNEFTRTSNSSLSIQIDRRDVAANLTTPLPTKIIQINVQSRTVLATNKYDDLKVWLYFSEPVLNTSEQILHALSTSEGQLLLTNEDTLGNQRFIYQIQILSPISIVTVTMNPNSIISRQGTAVLATEPMTIFYDIQRPAVSLSSSILRTRDSRIPIRIEFNKNVFGFNSSRVSVEGGHVIPDSFYSKTGSIYDVDIGADEDLVFVSINENVTSDIAGNENLVSNRLLVGHYNSVPEESIVASTFTTSTFGLTTLASGLLTLTIATLQANPALSPQSAPLMPDPSQNLFRILGHIQVFALSRWIAVDLPIGYYEFVRGLGWSIPYLRLPWEKNGHVSTPPATSINDTQNLKTILKEDIRDSFAPVFSSPLAPIFLSSSSRLKAATPAQIKRELGDKNKTKNFCGGPQKSCGWKVFEKLMFWTGVLDLSILLVVRVFIFYMLRFKKSRSGCRTNFGSLAFPRIEILLTVHALSEVSMALAFLIHGRSTSGVIVAVLIWGIVSFILLASFLFLFIGITCGKLIKYEETPQREDMGTSPWLQCFTRAIVGPAKQGKWTSKNQFEVKFGPLFEDLRGPSKLSIETQNDSFSFVRKFLAGPGIYYTILQLVSKVTQGILNGVFPDDPSTKAPAIILLSLSSLQLFFLVLTKPFIFRRLQFVETVAVTTEVVMFASTVFSKQEPYDHGKKAVGITLLVLFLVSYLVQTINLWHGMYEQIKRLDNRRGSFVLGFRIGFKIFRYLFTDTVLVDGNSTESQTAAGTEDPEAEQSGALVKKSSSKEGTTSASASLPSSSNKPRHTALNKKVQPISWPRQFLRWLIPGVLSFTSNQVTEEEKSEGGYATDQVTEEAKFGNNGIEHVSEEEPKMNTVRMESQNAAGTEDPEAKQLGALVRKSSSKEGTTSASASLPSSLDNKPRPTWLNKKLPPPSRPRQFLRGLAPGVLGQISNLVTEEEKFEEGNATDPVTEEEKKEKTSGIDQATEEEPKEENQRADRVTEEEKEGNNGLEQVSEEEPKVNAVPVESQNAAGTEDPEAKQSGALVRKSTSKPSSSDNKLRPTGLNMKLPTPSRPRQFIRGLAPGVLGQIGNLVTEEEKFKEGNATDPVTEEEKKEKTSGIDQATEEEPKDENQSADRVTDEEREWNNGIEQVSEEEPKMNAVPIESRNAAGTEDLEAKQSGALVRKISSKEGTASASASLPSSSDNKPRPTGLNKKLPPPSRPRQFLRGLGPGVLSQISNLVTEEQKFEGNATDPVTEEEKKEKTSGIDQATEEEPKEENQSADRVTQEEQGGNNGIEQVREEEPKMNAFPIESQNASGTEDPEAKQSGALVRKSTSKEGTASAGASLPSSSDNKPRPTGSNKKLPPPSRPRQFQRGLCPGVLSHTSNQVTEEEKGEEGHATDQVTEEEKKEKTSGIDQVTEEEPKEENQSANRVTEEEKEGNSGIEQVSEEEPKMESHEITDEEKREKTSGIDKVCEEEPQGGHRADGVTREESSCVELVAEKEKREETHTTDQVDEENKM